MSELPPDSPSRDPQHIRDLLRETFEKMQRELDEPLPPADPPGMAQLREELFDIKDHPDEHTQEELDNARRAIWQREQEWLDQQQIPPDDSSDSQE